MTLGLLLVLAGSACSSRALESTAGDSLEALATKSYAGVERERSKQRLAPLQRNETLDRIAREHSRRMASGRVPFGHKGSEDRADQVRTGRAISTVAENVAKLKGYPDPASNVVRGWVESRGHRRNILGDYDLSGMGVARSRDGTLYFTQLFAKLDQGAR